MCTRFSECYTSSVLFIRIQSSNPNNKKSWSFGTWCNPWAFDFDTELTPLRSIRIWLPVWSVPTVRSAPKLQYAFQHALRVLSLNGVCFLKKSVFCFMLVCLLLFVTNLWDWNSWSKDIETKEIEQERAKICYKDCKESSNCPLQASAASSACVNVFVTIACLFH